MDTYLGKVLIVDDEPDIIEIINYNLKKAGYLTETAINGDDAIQKAGLFKPDLILLDVMMPGKDGYHTIKILRQNADFKNTVIIFLTALSDEKSEIQGLSLGADDYITKPIKMELLLTRLKSAFRRIVKSEEEEKSLVFGDLEINVYKFTINYKDQEIVLAKKEFELLRLLATKPGRVFGRSEILEKVWGGEVIVGDRTIDVHVRKIRQKLGIDVIKTVKGVGYKFEF